MLKLLITDLDNTLYDWVGFYIPSFLAMIAELSRLSGHTEDDLKAAFKRVHQRHRSTEYAFAIEELDILGGERNGNSVSERLSKYAPAIHAFRDQRSKLLRLYSGVAETLEQCKKNGMIVAAITDTTTYYASRRLEQLGIDHLFDVLCAPADPGVPGKIDPRAVRKYADARYEVAVPVVLPSDELSKPDPRLVDRLISYVGVERSEAILIGDSMYRDISMARRAGVWDVHAAYGTQVDPSFYRELLLITYLTPTDVYGKEMDLVTPTFKINAFPELLAIIRDIESQARTQATTALR